MRIWDIQPKKLCRQHLLGEHRELHAIFNILHKDKQGYKQHPETQRWIGKLAALDKRHEQLTTEMKRRGYQHNSPLPTDYNSTCSKQTTYVNTVEEQIQILQQKNCNCKIEAQ